MTRRSRWLRNGAVVAAALCLLGFGVLQLSRARSYQLLGRLVHRVETTAPVVALTFDDGPTRRALDRLLPILAEHDVRATFFVIGSVLQQDPSLGQRLAAAGHELGNHSYSHRRMMLESYRFMETEVERTDELIRATGYAGPIHFRPPFGRKLLLLPLYLARSGRTTVTWDIEPDSYPEIAADADSIARYVADNVRPGSIILLHPMYASRATSLAAVPKVIERLKAQGYRFVTVSELIEGSWGRESYAQSVQLE